MVRSSVVTTLGPGSTTATFFLPSILGVDANPAEVRAKRAELPAARGRPSSRPIAPTGGLTLGRRASAPRQISAGPAAGAVCGVSPSASRRRQRRPHHRLLDDERHVGRHFLAHAAREIVEHDDVVPTRAEGTHEVRAEEPRAAGDEDRQITSMSS